MTLAWQMSICTQNLMEIGPEMAQYTSLRISKMAAEGHLGFISTLLWTTHNVTLGGLHFL